MKKKVCLLLFVLAPLWTHAADTFLPEAQMQDSLLQMLARFTTYMKADFQPCQEPNSVGEACGAFRSNSTMRSNEDGVRPNADKVVLPPNVSWQDLELMARQSLVFAYSTHKANRLKVCSDGRYWGSLSQRDHAWESSLWSMSVAYSAKFQWDSLTQQQRHYIYQLLKSECNYELERSIPTGFEGDTKAEENGWEVDVLAAQLLFPSLRPGRAFPWRQSLPRLHPSEPQLLPYQLSERGHPGAGRGRPPIIPPYFTYQTY